MSTLLLDTDVFSYLFKNHPLAGVYRPLLKGHILAISFMTVAELFPGAFRAAWGDRQVKRLEAQVKSCLVIPSSHEMSKKWGKGKEQAKSQERKWNADTHSTGHYGGLQNIVTPAL